MKLGIALSHRQPYGQSRRGLRAENARHARRLVSAILLATALSVGVTFVPQSAFAAAGAPLMAVKAATPAPGCPDVLFLAARGSGQPDAAHPHLGQYVSGMGRDLDSLYGQITTDLKIPPQPSLGRPLTVKPLFVVYPAANVDVLKLSAKEKTTLRTDLLLGSVSRLTSFAASYVTKHLQVFLVSIDAGIQSAKDQLTSEAAQCPNTRFVLAGYSQGAMVMHELLLWLNSPNNSEGPGYLRRIVATVLITDPEKVPGTNAMRFGTADSTAQGIRTFAYGYAQIRGIDVPNPSSTYDICNVGDLVCNASWPTIRNPAAISIHEDSYQDNQTVRNVGSEIAKTLLGQLPGVVDHLNISPATTTVAPGTPQAYAATAIDPLNRPLGDVTSETTFGISPDGECQESVCTATLPGVHKVTGARNQVTGITTLTVLPPHQQSGDTVYSVQGAEGLSTIWIRHAVDGSTTQLTSNYGEAPDVSPDGSKIVYIARDPNPEFTLPVTWVMNSDGSNPAALDPQAPTSQYADKAPRWSPDGTQISVSRNYAFDQNGFNNNNGYSDIFILNASSGASTAVTSDHQSIGPASWSPDGQRLAYFQNPGGLTIVNKDGLNLHAVSLNDGTQVYDPEWASSGDRIYVDNDVAGIKFFSSNDGFATTAAAPAQRLMTGAAFRDHYPRVSSDGSTVLFAGYDRCPDDVMASTCLRYNLFTVGSGGGTPTLLTSTKGGYEPSFVKK